MQGDPSRGFFNGNQFDCRLADGIGPKPGPRRKDAYTLIASQPWRSNGAFPAIGRAPMKYKDDPNMGEGFKLAKSLRDLIRGEDFEPGDCIWNQAWLARDTELFGEAGAEQADGFETKAAGDIAIDMVGCSHEFWFLVSGFWFLVSGFWFLVQG
jgi:hypothetical protein